MKFGTRVHYTKTSKLSYSAKPDSACGGFGGHFPKWLLSQKLRGVVPSTLTLYIGFVRRRFQKKYCQMYRTTLSDIMKAILQNGGHFQGNTSISEAQRSRTFNVDAMYRFCGAYIPEKVFPNTSCHCIRQFGGHLTKMGTIFNIMRVIFETMRQRNVTDVSTHIISGQHHSDSALLRSSHTCGHNLAGCCDYVF